jgi:ATP-dependent protease HslVU (ClpYQ) peptidase subunit
MSVVTYRDGTLVSDSRLSEDDVIWGLTPKIMRLSSGCLLGFTGDADARFMVKLLDKVTTPKKIPTSIKLKSFDKIESEGLLVFPSGEGWFIVLGKEGEAIPALTIGGFAAIGSGAHFALGAMEHGATAIQAARIACKRVSSCGMPLHYIKLEGDGEIKNLAR